MQQAKVSLTHSLIQFLNEFKRYGYKDKSSMVRAALLKMQADLEKQQLLESAELYAEIYETDEELKELTELAALEWPE